MIRISVVGSMNMDLVTITDSRPLKGETVTGRSFMTNPGGKGANQAVSAARLGGEVTMLGCVGDDLNGKGILQNLLDEGIDTRHISCPDDCTSGIANIVLAENDNSIIVIPGANNAVDAKYIDGVGRIIADSDMVLTQLEIPLAAVVHLAEMCKRGNVPLLLNPAPAVPLPQELIDSAAYIIPNEIEVRIVFPGETDMEKLLRLYPNKLVVTLGEKGVVFCDGEGIIYVPTIPVTVVDTTGAGDTFIGAFAHAICSGMDMTGAVGFANSAAALSVTKLGAQSGMPTLDEVRAEMDRVRSLTN